MAHAAQVVTPAVQTAVYSLHSSGYSCLTQLGLWLVQHGHTYTLNRTAQAIATVAVRATLYSHTSI